MARHKRGNGNSPQGPSPTLPIPALASALGAVLDVQKELAEKDFAKDTIQVGKVDAVDAGVMYVSLVNNAVGSSSLPPYGDARRDVYLSDMWRKEPILAGTVDAMVLKAGAWDWTLTGGRNTVAKYHNILSMFDGEMAGWQAGVQRLVLSLMTLDRGAFNEVVRERGKPTGNVTGLATLDPLRCRPTADPEFPVIWQNYDTGGWQKVPADQCFHQAVMPQPFDKFWGWGFSPVSRALAASEILMMVSDFDREKLSSMPPAGVVTTSGITKANLDAAFKMYRADRQNRGMATFPGLLWLYGGAGAGGAGATDVKFTPFAQLPDGFQREAVTTMYVKTLALCFGVDVAEIWQVERGGLGQSLGEAVIQNQKAAGKGPGDMAAGIERNINLKVLSPGCVFEFDQKSDAADVARANMQQVQAETIGKMVDRMLLDPAEARQLLARYEIIPSDMVESEVVVQDDAEKMMREAAWRRGEDIVRANRKGDVLAVWKAARQFGMYVKKGGAGSGNWGHSGRPGAVGGSGSGGGNAGGAQTRAIDEVRAQGRAIGDYDEFIKEDFPGWEGSLSDDERLALERYTMTDYGWMNKALRTGNMSELDSYDKKQLSDVRAAVLRAKLPESVIVYRGRMSTVSHNVGDVIADDGFISTTTNREYATGRARRYGKGTTYEILLPKGSSAAPISNLLGKGMGEQELLLAPGSRFRVVGSEKGTGYMHYILEMNERVVGKGT